MNEIDATRALLTDAFDRIAEQVQAVTSGLSDDAATWRPDPDANSIAWLLWHLTRIEDDHIAGLAGGGQVWLDDGWQQRFGLPFDADDHGYGHSSEQVGQVTTAPGELADYHAAVRAATQQYLDTLTVDELTRVVDTNWDPPVTAAVRLVSMINDCMEHVGQAAYVRGMWDRR